MSLSYFTIRLVIKLPYRISDNFTFSPCPSGQAGFILWVFLNMDLAFQARCLDYYDLPLYGTSLLTSLFYHKWFQPAHPLRGSFTSMSLWTSIRQTEESFSHLGKANIFRLIPAVSTIANLWWTFAWCAALSFDISLIYSSCSSVPIFVPKALLWSSPVYFSAWITSYHLTAC